MRKQKTRFLFDIFFCQKTIEITDFFIEQKKNHVIYFF